MRRIHAIQGRGKLIVFLKYLLDTLRQHSVFGKCTQVEGDVAKRKAYDWEAIERTYRLGQKSMRAIADEFGPNVSNISRRAKKFGWVQDKTEEVRQKTNATLLAQHERNVPTTEDIDLAVRTNVEVVTGQRKRIGRGQQLVSVLLKQLDEAAKNRDEIENAIIDETAGKGEGEKADLKRRSLMLRAVSLPGHAAVLRNLATASKDLTAQERQAFNIDSTVTPGTTIEDIIRAANGDK